MELLRCYIENFGKLSDFKYEFKKGLNIINENNGFGKTTFASFIKAMFYGLESTSKRTTALTDRKKYMPWQGGNFGGNLEFKIENKSYKIERYFGKKDSEDTFKLYDLDTNLESTNYSENIGEEIFKINKEAYERSTYIPQQKIKIEMNDSINAKLGNILESENDINTSEEAIKKLSDCIKNYKKTSKRGLIDIEKANIDKIEKKIEENKFIEKNIEEREEKLKKVLSEIKENEEKKLKIQENITKIIDLKRKDAKKETYETINKKYKESKIKYEEIENFFNGDIPEDEEIEILIDKCLEIEKYKVECENYEINDDDKKMIEKLNAVYKDKNINENIIRENIADYNEIKDTQNRIETAIVNKEHNEKECKQLENKLKSSKIIVKILLVVFCILFALGIVLCFYNKFMGIGLIALSVIFIIIGIIKKGKNKKSNILLDKCLKNIEELDEVIRKLKTKRESLASGVDNFIKEFTDDDKEDDTLIKLTEIKSDYNKYIDLNNNLNLILERQSTTRTKLELLQESIKEYLLKYFDVLDKPFRNLSEEIKMKKQEFKAIKIEYENNSKQKEEYEINNDIKEIIDVEDTNVKISKEELEKNSNQIEEKLNTLNDEKNYIKNQIDKMECELEESRDLEQDLLETKDKIESLEKKLKIMQNTKNMLEKAKEQFSSHYLGGMIDGFNKYIKLINKEEINTYIDVNLDTKVEYKGSQKDVEFLSTGYKDLIYLCMRFSLIDSLFENQKPFVILDDPFVNLDEEKTKEAIKIINKLSNNYQIIYFICHNSRA